jgi:hypothetical protein
MGSTIRNDSYPLLYVDLRERIFLHTRRRIVNVSVMPQTLYGIMVERRNGIYQEAVLWRIRPLFRNS